VKIESGSCRNLAPGIALLILLAVVLTAISGCGGGSSSAAGQSAGQAISKADLIKKGDAICAKTDKIQTSRMAAYVKKDPKATETKSAFIEMVKKVALPPVRSEVEELASLGTPKGAEKEFAAIIIGFEKAQKSAEANARFAMGLTEGPFTAPAKLAAKLGFKACAKPL
jgi:hypothetical protein